MPEPLITHNRFAERVRPDDAVLLVIDAQRDNVARAAGADSPALRNNLLGLAKVCRAHGLPAVFAARHAEPFDPILDELLEIYGPETMVVRRHGSFFNHRSSRAAVLRHGAHHLILAAFGSAATLADAALAGAGAGFDTHAVLDTSACGDGTTRRIAEAQMAVAGINLTTWVAIMAELAAADAASDGSAAAALAAGEHLALYTPTVRVTPDTTVGRPAAVDDALLA